MMTTAITSNTASTTATTLVDEVAGPAIDPVTCVKLVGVLEEEQGGQVGGVGRSVDSIKCKNIPSYTCT